MEKSLKRGRPRSSGPTRIPRQFRFHPITDRLLREIWKRERLLATRTITRQEIIEKAVVAYAVTYHPRLVKDMRLPELPSLQPSEEAVPA